MKKNAETPNAEVLLARTRTLLDRAKEENWIDQRRMSFIPTLRKLRGDVIDAQKRAERARARVPYAATVAAVLERLGREIEQIPPEFVSTWQMSLDRVKTPASVVFGAVTRGIAEVMPNPQRLVEDAQEFDRQAAEYAVRLADALRAAEEACGATVAA